MNYINIYLLMFFHKNKRLKWKNLNLSCFSLKEDHFYGKRANEGNLFIQNIKLNFVYPNTVEGKMSIRLMTVCLMLFYLLRIAYYFDSSNDSLPTMSVRLLCLSA